MRGTVRTAELELPSILYGNDLQGLFTRLALNADHVHGDTWRVRAAAAPNGRQDDVVRVRTLAGPTLRSAQFDVLPTLLDELPPFELPEKVRHELQRRRAEAATTTHFNTRLSHYQRELTLTDLQHYRAMAEELFDLLGHGTDDAVPYFPDRSLHVVTTANALYSRSVLPAVILRGTQDPQFIGELQAGTAQVPGHGRLFGASTSQSASLLLAGSFMGPLWGSLLPYMWAFPSNRLMSTTVFGLGRTAPATMGGTPSLQTLLPLTAVGTNPEQPTIGPASIVAAIDWWVMRINQLFWYLTDPATYADSSGRYVAHEHLHWMMTIDQVLKLTTAMQAAGFRDRAGQRTQAFTLLGCFADRLFDRRVNLTKLFTLSYARRQFEAVKNAMPAPAADVLLPAAERALNALEQLQKGFFITAQRRLNAVMIYLPGQPQPTALNLEHAAARLMVVHRNATHGYGGLDDPQNPQSSEINERLIAQHDGEIPGDIALLPYLYLLVLLISPEQTRDRIISRVEKS